MSRFVKPKSPGLAAGGEDDFKTRLAKYVPAEIITLYTAAVGGVISTKPDSELQPCIALGLIVFFLLATIAYFGFKAPKGVIRNAHLVASPVAFLALAYPIAATLLGGWFIGWVAVLGQAAAAVVAWLMAPEEKPANG
jgi:hypothetical protein